MYLCRGFLCYFFSGFTLFSLIAFYTIFVSRDFIRACLVTLLLFPSSPFLLYVSFFLLIQCSHLFLSLPYTLFTIDLYFVVRFLFLVSHFSTTVLHLLFGSPYLTLLFSFLTSVFNACVFIL
jgi:hypothetical protein